MSIVAKDQIRYISICVDQGTTTISSKVGINCTDQGHEGVTFHRGMANLLLEVSVLVVVGPVLNARELDLLGVDKYTYGFVFCQTAM